MTRASRGTPAKDKFWGRVREDPSGCWFWTGRKQNGYGVFWQGNGMTDARAHRWSYEYMVADVPEGLDLDHLCHTEDKSCPGGKTCPHRACVNPYHLEPVTRKENAQRGRMTKTHCPRGHEYAVYGEIVNSGGKRCKPCRKYESARRKLVLKARAEEQLRASQL